MSNATHCKRCGMLIESSGKATNQRYCGSECRDLWWNEKRTKGANFKRSKVEVPSTDMAYIAGFLDGEGTIGIWRETRKGNTSGYRYKAVVQIYNTNRAVLDWIQREIGGFIIQKNAKSAVENNHKLCYAWTCPASKVRSFLIQVRPYLKIKIKQLNVVLEFCSELDNAPARTSSYHERFDKLHQQTKALNERGTHSQEPPGS